MIQGPAPVKHSLGWQCSGVVVILVVTVVVMLLVGVVVDVIVRVEV